MVSDFALVDAIECGIVKLPRVPVSDNAVNADMPVFRNLWDHIGKQMPKKGAGKSGELDPDDLPPDAPNGALRALQPLRGGIRRMEARRHQGAAGVHRRLQQHRHLEARL